MLTDLNRVDFRNVQEQVRHLYIYLYDHIDYQ